MNDLDNYYLMSALHRAKNVTPVAGARVAAFLKVGNMGFIGYNSRKTHPFQAKWAKNDKAICLHAEIDAIKNALRIVDVDELSQYKTALYVARAKADGTPGLAKPCEGCARCIAAFDIKEVYWTE